VASVSPCSTNTNIGWHRDVVVDGSDTAQLPWRPANAAAAEVFRRRRDRRVDLQSGVAINKRCLAPTDRPTGDKRGRTPAHRDGRSLAMQPLQWRSKDGSEQTINRKVTLVTGLS